MLVFVRLLAMTMHNNNKAIQAQQAQIDSLTYSIYVLSCFLLCCIELLPLADQFCTWVDWQPSLDCASVSSPYMACLRA